MLQLICLFLFKIWCGPTTRPPASLGVQGSSDGFPRGPKRFPKGLFGVSRWSHFLSNYVFEMYRVLFSILLDFVLGRNRCAILCKEDRRKICFLLEGGVVPVVGFSRRLENPTFEHFYRSALPGQLGPIDNPIAFGQPRHRAFHGRWCGMSVRIQ